MRESEARVPRRHRKDISNGPPARRPTAPSSPISSVSAETRTVRTYASNRFSAVRGHSMRRENEDHAARVSPLGLSTVAALPESPLLLALFCDGFVCRHYTAENECVEGFAQPYDAESGYVPRLVTSIASFASGLSDA